MLLPLFPLHTVLLPAMPLELQIFETRYLNMVNYLKERQEARFAVHLIRKGVEAGSALPLPRQVGCIAIIQQIEEILASDRARLILRVIGSERVELRHLSVNEGGFYLAELEPLSYLPYDPQEKKALEQELLVAIRDFLTLPAVKNFNINLELLAAQGYALAYAMASMFGLSLALKQKILEENHVPEIYRTAIKIAKGELRLIRQSDAIRSAKYMGPYFIN